MSYTGSLKAAQRRRLQAMALLDQGLRQKQVAAKLGVTLSALSKWVKARQVGGDTALQAKPHTGRAPNATIDTTACRPSRLSPSRPNGGAQRKIEWHWLLATSVLGRHFIHGLINKPWHPKNSITQSTPGVTRQGLFFSITPNTIGLYNPKHQSRFKATC